jgi:adenylate kinase
MMRKTYKEKVLSIIPNAILKKLNSKRIFIVVADENIEFQRVLSTGWTALDEEEDLWREAWFLIQNDLIKKLAS